MLNILYDRYTFFEDQIKIILISKTEEARKSIKDCTIMEIVESPHFRPAQMGADLTKQTR
jgi:hypothetical protein